MVVHTWVLPCGPLIKNPDIPIIPEEKNFLIFFLQNSDFLLKYYVKKLCIPKGRANLGGMKKEFCSTNGYIKYAGIHLIVELWKAQNLSSLPKIREILKKAVQACGATLLKIDLHKFTPYGGISGVAIIQESHISIHSWPEYKYAAIDIFVCGDVDPYKAIPVLKKEFKPKELQVMEVKRGLF